MFRTRSPQRPVLLSPDAPPVFPDPRRGDDEGLVAIGGDLSSERLRAAYAAGIFPWYNEGFPVLWWSPNPRAILPPEDLHVSRSMARRLAKRDYAVTWNLAFAEVIAACGEGRKGGTWIVPEMRLAYQRLHHDGHAHSVEVWQANRLVGGLYGVQCGALFAAESMFHRVTDASKIAVIAASRSLSRAGVEVLDVQFATPHLRTLGVKEISRDDYLARVARASRLHVDLSRLQLSVD
ncbi:MAG TPA: leucyl/phenylalanyl-tRNA--protein transferase [Polyangiaceae bacterium]|nr:leucyl/phenylalanyl-tRNA--protein transferase [Polyangiaceae bacterium]